MLYLLLLFVAGYSLCGSASAAEAIDGWIKASDMQVTLSNPQRNRRSPDATLSASFKNTGTKALLGELRFFVTRLIPSTVSITNATGTLSGVQYFTLSSDGASLEPDAILSLPQIIVKNGGRTSFEVEGFVYHVPPDVPDSLIVNISTPKTLLTFGASPIEVNGTISDAAASLTINGVPISHENKTFSASIELKEGFNTIVARATNVGGAQVTDSIVASLDLTPPYLTIESPAKEQTVYSNTITVTGLVNDIVRGTVETAQAQVQVNGIDAQVSNRSYAAYNVPLLEGDNILTITGVDQSGNKATISQNVVYKVVTTNKLMLVSGQGQQEKIGNRLPLPLKVQLVDEQGEGIVGETVVFRVTQGAGIVGADTDRYGRAVIVDTDNEGFAQTTFQLGYRTGIANHKVKAKVVGFENEIIFDASATNVVADKISINSGNNQRGIASQTLPAPFVVAVTDNGANVVRGARVRFSVVGGGGKLQNGLSDFATTTDSDGRASAQLVLGDELANDVQRVNAVLIDSPAGVRLTAGFTATAYVAGAAGDTNVTGIILDNQDTPIPGVTVRIENTDRIAITNEQGQFKIDQAPVGPVHLIADGSTATVLGEFPSLSYHLVTIPGIDNPMPSPIYMVKLDTDNGVMAGLKDVELTLEKFPGFKLEIAKDSVTFPDGSREGIVSVTSVNASKVPMAPPNGMQPQFIVTIQPVGAIFSPAAKLTLPNVDGHAPGAQVEMYSFDHDLEEFVAIGLGTVSEDGSIVNSNPGVGVVKAGWHCGSQPGGSGTAHNCPRCQECSESSGNCVRDPGQDNLPRPPEQQTPEDCKTALCKGSKAEPGDVPVTDTIKGDCKKPGCDGKNVNMALLNDDADIRHEDELCKLCNSGVLDNKPDGTKNPEDECQACEGGNIKDISISVSGLPSYVCVNETKNFTAKIQPVGITGQINFISEDGLFTVTGSNDNYIIQGVSGHSEPDTLDISYKSCPEQENDILVLPRNVENIPGKWNRFTELDFLQDECPNYPNQDQLVAHPVDGCSGGIAQDPTEYGGLYAGYITGSQQYNRGQSTAFGAPQGAIPHAQLNTVLPLACNNHDICYQTCGSTQQQCDQEIFNDAVSTCNTVYPAACPQEFVQSGECMQYAEERQLCVGFATDVRTGLSAFGASAFAQRQTQHCLCCGN